MMALAKPLAQQRESGLDTIGAIKAAPIPLSAIGALEPQAWNSAPDLFAQNWVVAPQ
jgi:hypothetical protein